MRYFLIICCLSLFSFTNEESANAIVKKSEDKLRAASVIGVMTIQMIRPRWEKTMEVKAWVKGTEYAAAYILAPESDSGTVFLKNGDEVWNYLPKVKKTIKMPMNVLSQTWMGTDMSNDDLLNASTFSQDFEANKVGDVSFMGRECHKIALVPKDQDNTIWGKIILYIDKENYVQLHAQFYDESQELKHSLTGYDVKQVGGRILASKFVLLPNNARDQRTIVSYDELTFDAPISNTFFEKTNIASIQP